MQAVVTHLTHGDRRVNRGQVEALTSWVEQAAEALTLVGGDFNALPDSVPMQRLAGRWIDTGAAADGEGTCCVDDLNGATGSLDQRIDYLFMVPGGGHSATVRSSRRVLTEPFRSDGGWQWASDHAGLFVEIERAAPGA